ncbi:copper chaperone PCu(A)C [Arthrobacter sp. TMN-49]
MNKKYSYSALSALAASALLLTGCGQGVSAAAPSATVSASQNAAVLAVTDPWVKAAESGMSATFGTISNTTDQAVTVVGAATPAAKMVELHETVMGSNGTMKMQEKKGGFVIPAKGKLVLEPGANHIMLMGLTKPVKAGDDLTFTLKINDGPDVVFKAQGKDFVGANENYTGGEEPTDSATMDHGTMDHGSMDHGAN